MKTTASRTAVSSALLLSALWMACGSVADAQLVYHYDPATGNVSFDTTNTRTGKLHLYRIGRSCVDLSDDHAFLSSCNFGTPQWATDLPGDITFRVENQIRLGQGLAESLPNLLAEFTQSEPWEGIYTIGDVLPAGLSEDTWLNLISPDLRYTDLIGGGDPPPMEFVYGLPDGEFQNRWDLVDPDNLDWADEAQLIYREMTGELVLVTSSGEAGGHISGFLFQSVGLFDADGFTPPFETQLTTNDASHVGFFADAMEPGEYNLGSLLQPGLTADEYYASITNAEFFGQLGFGSNPLTLGTDGTAVALVYQAVPEPATSTLLAGIAAAMLLRRRHRRRALRCS